MPTYDLYIFPNCDKCHEVKDFLNLKNIKYDEIDLTSDEGNQKFKNIYLSIRDRIKRDEAHGNMVVMPVFIKNNDSGIEAIVQDIEGIKALFS
ncbi:hypothetical protein COS75_01760 [Candidatus Pacearchaeota archaeon CG06_land_8_20_14_3_00_35_12]|nr:MAG: hypothetical protein COS75_01760 [Candidatus Pacearchaeota archaeon CG06_land_8_20_14_3_00_35_12]PIY31488.1 MAG: hypothetical protein COZ08_08745 [Bacteroidetes bacterium CG_4_10_14_3_um_filter_42_6]